MAYGGRPVGPEPIEFNYQQLRALADLLSSMGIYEISLDPKKKDSDICVKYIEANEDVKCERLIWRKAL